MSRKAGAEPIAVLLDSTYLLPAFGISVRGLDEGDLLTLRDLAIRGLIKLYYSPISWLEVIPKVAREAKKKRIELGPEEVLETISAFADASYIDELLPDTPAYSLAYSLRLLGRRDMIDNILYATATSKSTMFLTIDRKLLEFVWQHGIREPRYLTITRL